MLLCHVARGLGAARCAEMPRKACRSRRSPSNFALSEEAVSMNPRIHNTAMKMAARFPHAPYLLAIWHTAGFAIRRLRQEGKPRRRRSSQASVGGHGESCPFVGVASNDCSYTRPGLVVMFRGPRAEARGYFPCPSGGGDRAMRHPGRKAMHLGIWGGAPGFPDALNIRPVWAIWQHCQGYRG